MRVNTRSNTRKRQVRSSIRQALTLDEKNKRKTITLFIARVVYAILERADEKHTSSTNRDTIGSRRDRYVILLLNFQVVYWYHLQILPF